MLAQDTVESRPASGSLNGFDLSFSKIPVEEILRGGPPKDGIPAITNPKILSASKATYLKADDLIIGVSIGGEARAYPLRILIWHENVNDTLGGVPIAVTYCPLCNSAFVFDRRIGGQVREFGISGLLWQSNVLLYDRQKRAKDESLWSQIKMEAVSGPAAKRGLRLKLLPSDLLRWGSWKAKYPHTTVLSDQTGFLRDYQQSPYQSYFESEALMFPAKVTRTPKDRFQNKDMIVVVQVADQKKGYAVKDVAAMGGELIARLGGRKIRLRHLPEADALEVTYADGKGGRPSVAYLYWFSLRSILPDVAIFDPQEEQL